MKTGLWKSPWQACSAGKEEGMGKEHRLLVINVGSTSTKVACFRGKDPEVVENIKYRAEDLVGFSSLKEQLPLRKEDVLEILEEQRDRPG